MKMWRNSMLLLHAANITSEAGFKSVMRTFRAMSLTESRRPNVGCSRNNIQTANPIKLHQISFSRNEEMQSGRSWRMRARHTVDGKSEQWVHHFGWNLWQTHTDLYICLISMQEDERNVIQMPTNRKVQARARARTRDHQTPHTTHLSKSQFIAASLSTIALHRHTPSKCNAFQFVCCTLCTVCWMRSHCERAHSYFPPKTNGILFFFIGLHNFFFSFPLAFRFGFVCSTLFSNGLHAFMWFSIGRTGCSLLHLQKDKFHAKSIRSKWNCSNCETASTDELTN